MKLFLNKEWNDTMKDKIFKLFSSNVLIKVTGKNVNNFIKRLIINKINLVKVIPVSYKEVNIIINYNDIDSINRIKSIYDVEIVKYYGKINFLKLIKKNIYIISFLVVGLLIIYILSNVIFNIEIIHSNSKIIKLLEEELASYGIEKYSFVKDYDEIDKIEKRILDDNKDTLEWLEIIRTGTKYIVRLEERIINNDIEDNVTYDIVAKKNAVIKYIIARTGEKIGEINTYVRKGDIVISSDITLPNNEKISTSASGSVVGETWYTVSVEYPYYYNEVLYTGNKKKVLVFNFLNNRFSLFDFDKYKSFDKNIKYIFNSNFIPLSLTYEYQYETKIINDIYTYEEAKDKAIFLAKNKILDKYSDIININKISVIKEENLTNKIRLVLFISCEEDITEYREVVKDEIFE